jgi:arylformamidase
MPHWPGDPPVEIPRFIDMDRGEIANVRKLSMSAHAGTHVDAPLHFVRDGASIDVMPLDATVGPARVIAVESSDVIGADELMRASPQPGERVLFKTQNSTRCCNIRCFLKQFVHINPEGARVLAAAEVRAVGVDYLSVGAYGDEGVVTHQILLEAGIWVIEGLNLAAVEPGQYELLCLPLRIAGGDGAPARAALRRLAG